MKFKDLPLYARFSRFQDTEAEEYEKVPMLYSSNAVLISPDDDRQLSRHNYGHFIPDDEEVIQISR